MKNTTKIIAITITLVTGLMQTPAAQHGIGVFLTAHPNVSAIIMGIISLGTLIHQPTNGGTNGTA